MEADKAGVASAEAAAIEKDAEKELAQAEPAMLAAADAVNCLSKAMLTELKSLPKPPAGVDKASARFCVTVQTMFPAWHVRSRNLGSGVGRKAACNRDEMFVSFPLRRSNVSAVDVINQCTSQGGTRCRHALLYKVPDGTYFCVNKC